MRKFEDLTGDEKIEALIAATPVPVTLELMCTFLGIDPTNTAEKEALANRLEKFVLTEEQAVRWAMQSIGVRNREDTLHDHTNPPEWVQVVRRKAEDLLKKQPEKEFGIFSNKEQEKILQDLEVERNSIAAAWAQAWERLLFDKENEPN